MKNINCVNACPYAEDNLECHGQCMTKQIDAEDEGIDYITDADLERGKSYHTTVIDQDYLVNGGW
ncbi:MAG: hypothetical protein H7Z73_12305 [Candidatus Saccharibacteria bacterium]|nr:hypothetical protein [Moraxellaceae bacterium]